MQNSGAKQQKDVAIVFCTHYSSARLLLEVNDIVSRTSGFADVWVLGTPKHNEDLCNLGYDRLQTITVTRTMLNSLPYSEKLKNLNPGDTTNNNDLAHLLFFRLHNTYRWYWFVEYDVRCIGGWDRFFLEFEASKADLLCSHLSDYCVEDDWWLHWDSVKTPRDVDRHQFFCRGLLVISRASKDALEAIDKAYTDGWAGHPEATWPTILKHGKMIIEDIGGNGKYTPHERKDRIYHSVTAANNILFTTLGVFPVYADEDFRFVPPNNDIVLWHPVKEIYRKS